MTHNAERGSRVLRFEGKGKNSREGKRPQEVRSKIHKEKAAHRKAGRAGEKTPEVRGRCTKRETRGEKPHPKRP